MSDRQIATLTAGAPLRALVPTDFEQVTRFAKMAVMAGMFGGNADDNTAIAQATMAVLQGMECGIPPMQSVQQIAVINGRCTVWGDLVPAMIWRAGHTIKEWIEGEGDERVAWCEIKRADNGEVITRKFSVADARKAKLWGKAGPWQAYDARMLQMRARGFCARDGVPDVLRGLYLREEMDDERFDRARDVTPTGKQSLTVDLMPPPAPDEKITAPVGPNEDKTSGEILLDLDNALTDCDSEDALHDAWGQRVQHICALGHMHRQEADALFEKHQARVMEGVANAA